MWQLTQPVDFSEASSEVWPRNGLRGNSCAPGSWEACAEEAREKEGCEKNEGCESKDSPLRSEPLRGCLAALRN
jgi:hypothetical protein